MTKDHFGLRSIGIIKKRQLISRRNMPEDITRARKTCVSNRSVAQTSGTSGLGLNFIGQCILKLGLLFEFGATGVRSIVISASVDCMPVCSLTYITKST